MGGADGLALHPDLLARTGLTEVEHQARTIASVKELRGLVTRVPVIDVVTGRDVVGYLRHVDMYRAAGLDLTTSQGVIGVGALVGRPAAEVLTIVTALHAAGLRRLHLFGVKGDALAGVAGLVESVDSSSWSFGARKRTGLCRHGVTRWESNCPEAAKAWLTKQQARWTPAEPGPPEFDDLLTYLEHLAKGA